MSFGHRVRVAFRKSAVVASMLLPREKSVRLERYLRGREDKRMLSESDVVVVSFGKSGRTWLMVLLSRYYQLRYQLPADQLLDHDRLHRLEPAVPRVFFTHDNYLADFTGDSTSKSEYAGKRVVLLVRHPADTAVSQYFQWMHRMKPRKRMINAYPRSNGNMTLADFLFGDAAGVPKIVGFMNKWASELDTVSDLLVIRYETLRRDTAKALGRILEFLGEKPDGEQLEECVRFASIENMRSLEREGFFQGLGNRLRPSDADNPESYKVRRGKVGGYRDYLSEEEAAKIDKMVSASLSPVYGYGNAAADRRIL